MEFFKDLEIEGGSKLDECMRFIIEGVRKIGWGRNNEKEKDYLKNGMHDGTEAFFIEYPGSRDCPAACICVIKRKDCIKVTNILPREVRELTKKQYNDILDEFDVRIVKPAVDQTGVSRIKSMGHKSIEQIMGQNAAQKLKVFSAGANKSTGSMHPCDRSRWFEFIIAAYQDESDICTEDLARWLEEDGWKDEKIICDLVCEYEFATELLRQYGKNNK